jgi:hypothetical protein
MPRLPQPPIVAALIRIAKGVDHILRHVHEMKEQAMADKAEVLAQIADVKTLVVELTKDVGRAIDKLDEAVANQNFDEVSTAVADLRTAIQDVDARVEAAAPEPATPEQPTV